MISVMLKMLLKGDAGQRAMADPHDGRSPLHHSLYRPQSAHGQSRIRRYTFRSHRSFDLAKRPKLLLGDRGRPLQTIANKLANRQDNRPMNLQE